MKKIIVVMFLSALFCAQPASAQPAGPAALENQIYKRDNVVVNHDAQLETLNGTMKAMMQFCARVGSREELQKKLDKRNKAEKDRKVSKKPPQSKAAETPKATVLPDPPQSCDRADLEKYLKQLQAAVSDHEARIKALEAIRAELLLEIKKYDARSEARFNALLAELGKRFPQLKTELKLVAEAVGNYDKLLEHFGKLLERMDKLEKEMRELQQAFGELETYVHDIVLHAKNKQSALRFQLAPVVAGHYDGDITRVFGLMSAELVIPLNQHFALSTGGALGKGPRGFGTMFRAGGEVGGHVSQLVHLEFRFAGVGTWDFRHAGTITRWIGGTVGFGLGVSLYRDRPEYNRPPAEFIFFVDGGFGWLAQYGKDTASPLGMAGIGIRF